MGKNAKIAGHEFTFSKKYGQNFISDTNLLRAIVADSKITSEDIVIEIGAGAGSLTAELAQVAGQVIAYEIDESLRPILTDAVGDLKNVEVVYGDFMKVPDSELRAIGKFAVVANLPYYITTPIMLRLMEGGFDVSSMTVMVQDEVAMRLCAKPAHAEYGSITVAVQYFGLATYARKVSRQLFYPVPNVDSAVIHIERQQVIQPVDPALFKKLYRCGFAMRRKTLVNNMLATLKLPRALCENALSACGFDVNIRGETLSAADFCRLSDQLSKLIS